MFSKSLNKNQFYVINLKFHYSLRIQSKILTVIFLLSTNIKFRSKKVTKIQKSRLSRKLKFYKNLLNLFSFNPTPHPSPPHILLLALPVICPSINLQCLLKLLYCHITVQRGQSIFTYR